MALVFEHQLLHEGEVLNRGKKYILRSDVMFSGPSGCDPMIARIARQHGVSEEEAAATAIPLLRAHGRELLEQASLDQNQDTREGRGGGYSEVDDVATHDAKRRKKEEESEVKRRKKEKERCSLCKRFRCIC